jgi:hypothetical protein
MAKKNKEFNKVTAGFVTQRFKLVKGKYVCIGQMFTASDSVSFEEIKYGESIKPTPAMQRVYQTYDMRQPL